MTIHVEASGERIWEIRAAVKDHDTLSFKDGDQTCIAAIDDEPAAYRTDAMVVEDQHGALYAIFIPLGNIVGHPEAHFIAHPRPPLAAGTRVRITANWPMWEGHTGEVVLHDGGRFSVFIKLDDMPEFEMLPLRDDPSTGYHIAADQRSVEVIASS